MQPAWDCFLSQRWYTCVSSVTFSGILCASASAPSPLPLSRMPGTCLLRHLAGLRDCIRFQITLLAPFSLTRPSPHLSLSPFGSIRSNHRNHLFLPCSLYSFTVPRSQHPKQSLTHHRGTGDSYCLGFTKYQEQTPRMPLKNVLLEKLILTSRITFRDVSLRPVGSQPDLFQVCPNLFSVPCI